MRGIYAGFFLIIPCGFPVWLKSFACIIVFKNPPQLFLVKFDPSEQTRGFRKNPGFVFFRYGFRRRFPGRSGCGYITVLIACISVTSLDTFFLPLLRTDSREQAEQLSYCSRNSKLSLALISHIFRLFSPLSVSCFVPTFP